MINLVRKATGDPNADLWTLQFNSNDQYLTKDKINPQFISGLPIRTHEDIEKEMPTVKRLFNYLNYNRNHNHYFRDCSFLK